MADAYARGFIGKNIFGSGRDLDVYVHSGAGAYEVGRRVGADGVAGRQAWRAAHQASLPCRRGTVGLPDRDQQCRNAGQRAPHHPGRRTVVCRSWHAEERRHAPRSASAATLETPGVYELPLGYNFKKLIYDVAGGIQGGRKLKAVVPGGSSVPILLPDEIDYPFDLRRNDQGRLHDGFERRHRARRDHVHGALCACG